MGVANISGNILTDSGASLSSYLPLTGGTLTGALNGTSATFSSSVTVTGDLSLFSGGTANNFNTYALGVANTKYLVFGSPSAAQPSRMWSGGIGADSSENIFTGAYNNYIFGTGSSLTERMRITSSGNVGIGSTNPTARLDINNTSGDANLFLGSPTGSGSFIKLFNNSIGKWFIGTNATGSPDNDLAIYGYGGQNGNIISYTNGAERMRITSGGNLLVGQTSDNGSRIQATANMSGWGYRYFNSWSSSVEVYVSHGGGYGMAIDSAANTSGVYLLKVAGGDGTNRGTNEWFRVHAHGLVYITSLVSAFTTSSGANMYVNPADGAISRSTSSIKYKKNVNDYTKGLSEVMQLRPVSYEGKSEIDAGKTFAGLIAEEVHDLGLTEFVQYAADGSPDALAYQNMVALLTKAIQELSAKVTALENK